MAAGLGFKTFTTGEVLTAADVNGYLMQGVLVFASEAARNAAITSPQEGQFAYTKDNNSLWYYTGSAWAASGATGDIEGVTAGVGISGGGTSGTVTITNSMATAIDAKGDLIVGTGADTFSRLAVGGTNGHVLTVDSGEATGMKWAAASSTPTFVGCSVYSTSGQTISNNTYTLLTFDSENFDTDGFHSTTTNTGRITIPSGKDGKYLFLGWQEIGANEAGARTAYLRKNGNIDQFFGSLSPDTGSYQPTHHFIKIVEAVATDYFEFLIRQDSGGNLTTVANSNVSLFQCFYLGA